MSVAWMHGQLRQVSLDIGEGDALAGLVGVAEHIGGDQLGSLDPAHGQDGRSSRAYAFANRRAHIVPTICPESLVAPVSCCDPFWLVKPVSTL